MPHWQPTELSSPSPTMASAFPRLTSIGCSSAITAAAMSQGSSAPVSVFTWSRWWSICTAVPPRWKAKKARVRVLPSACREGPLPQRRRRQSRKRRRLPIRPMPYNPSLRESVNEAKPYDEGSCTCRSGCCRVGIDRSRRRHKRGKRPRRPRRLADARATAAAVPQPLHVREFHQPAVLLGPLRHRLSILLLLGSVLRLLPSRPRLLRLERYIALPPVTS